VSDLDGETQTLDVHAEQSIYSVKMEMYWRTGVPLRLQRLYSVAQGRYMPDRKTLKEMQLTNGASLHMLLSLRGGAVSGGTKLQLF
jgi:ubiquitin-like protein Nedd8